MIFDMTRTRENITKNLITKYGLPAIRASAEINSDPDDANLFEVCN